jgi:hypothetical protein
MGALWLWVFEVPFGPEAVRQRMVEALIYPAVLLFVPLIVSAGHNFWPGYVALATVMNWLLYTQLVYVLIRWRRWKGQSPGDNVSVSPAHEEANYWDRWKQAKSTSCDTTKNS